MPVDNPRYITTQRTPSGYMACMMVWLSYRDSYEIASTGAARHPKKSMAIKEAQKWAETSKLEYRP